MNYREYYQHCRAVYGHPSTDAPSVYDLHFAEVHPGRAELPWMPLPPDYGKTIAALARRVDRRFAEPSNLYPVPAIEGYARLLFDFWGLEELEALARLFVPALEAHLYGCHVAINQINVVRTVPSADPPRSSWLWHYDDNPDESVKILLYLTPVTERSGAFEYLWHAENRQGCKVPSSRAAYGLKGPQRWPKSRVPASEVRRLTAEGYAPRRLVGPPGTFVLFDNNAVHRATIPREAWRDVVIFNFRPAHEPVRPYVDRRHTGSWDYNAKNWDPFRMALPETAETTNKKP